MYPRLKLARNLLTDDGVIFISIDDTEQANLRAIADEVFGAAQLRRHDRLARSEHGAERRELRLGAGHEYIVVYARDATERLVRPLTDETDRRASHTRTRMQTRPTRRRLGSQRGSLGCNFKDGAVRGWPVRARSARTGVELLDDLAVKGSTERAACAHAWRVKVTGHGSTPGWRRCRDSIDAS